jgi:ferric-dicitrate binding protein FerR (iron transport regulator)
MNKEYYISLFEKYIANEATAQDIKELVLYLQTNPKIDDWFEQQVRDSSPEISEELKQKMFDRIQEKINEPEKELHINPAPVRQWLRIAASILLPFMIALGCYYFYTSYKNDADNPLLIVVGRGEKANITLPDGSRVWLNSDTKLTYNNTYNKKERFLQMDGEAYFEVVPDANKKFIVRCAGMEVEVLGTTFGIKAYDEDSIISTVLVEGSVQLTLPNQIYKMKLNERIVLNKSNHNLTAETVNVTDFTEWRKNRLRFENESIQDIVKTIARMHNIDCVFADESIKNLRFTGSVDNTSIESILNVIALTAPVTYTVNNGSIIIYKDNRKKQYFN